MTTQRPNLFKYGRKELSQDAMICWLLDWANKCYADVSPALHEAGQNFAKALFGKHHNRPGPESICRVELEMQASSIDVLAWINGKYALLIEDKTDSNEHSGQLERYHALVLNGELSVGEEDGENFFPIFLKTGNISRAKKCFIENAENEEGKKLTPPYRVFEREDFLNVLKGCNLGASEILSDFFDHLSEREKRSGSWKDKSLVDDWSGDAWGGFYRSLEEKIDPGNAKDMDWNYIPNQAGGFWGLWWYFHTVAEDCLYLQTEQEKLCFKISVGDSTKRSERRQHWHERIMQTGESLGLPIGKPARFGSGTHMTVAVLKEDWRKPDGEGRLDLGKTVGVLEQAERVVKEAVRPPA